MLRELDVMIEVFNEVCRFRTKLEKAIRIMQADDSIAKGYTHNQHVAAAKRSALDLKQELTKITQILKYRNEQTT